MKMWPAVAQFLPDLYAGSQVEGKEFLVLQDLVAAGFRAPPKTKTLR
jgi:hypothetical protein